MLVHAFTRSAKTLVVGLVLPRLGSALPELPLRAVAQALQCHEYLVPAAVASAIEAARPSGERGCGVRAYLMRAMPQSMLASQCFRQHSAERSTP
jgi:hypothetical protein